MAEARPCLDESLAIAERTGDAQETTASLRALGLLASYEGNYVAAREFDERAISIARTLDDTAVLLALLNELGDIHRALADPATAVSAYEESLAGCREQGFLLGVAVCLSNLTHARIALGEVPAAARDLRESLETSRRVGTPDCEAAGLDAAAVLAAARGEWGRAVRIAGAATRGFDEMGRHRAAPDEREQATLHARARAALREDAYAAAWASGQSLSLASAVEETLTWLGASGPAV